MKEAATKQSLQNVSTRQGPIRVEQIHTNHRVVLQNVSVVPETCIPTEESTFGLGSPEELKPQWGSLVQLTEDTSLTEDGETGNFLLPGRTRGAGLRGPSALLHENHRPRTTLGR